MVKTFEDRLRQARMAVARQKALEYLGPDWILHWTKDKIQRNRRTHESTSNPRAASPHSRQVARRVQDHSAETTNLHRDGEPDAITENALTQTNAFTLAMAKLFENDNPKFKQMQFIAACNRDLVE